MRVGLAKLVAAAVIGGAVTLGLGVPGALAAGPCGSSGVFALSGSTASCSYAYSGGEDTFTVPAGFSSLGVTAVGAPGGRAPGPGAPSAAASPTSEEGAAAHRRC